MEVNAPTPTQIGHVARALDASHFVFTNSSSVEQRQKAFDSVHLLLQQIRNVPDTARANLRLRDDSLVAKDANRYYPLIDNFTLPKQDGSTRNALQALGMNVCVKQSFKDKLLCVSSKIIGKITGTAIRDRHLTLTHQELKRLATAKLQTLPIGQPGYNGVMWHIDAAFFVGRTEAALELSALSATPLHLYNLRGADLSDRDLSGSSLPMDLTGANLQNTRLCGVAFGQSSEYQKHLEAERITDRAGRAACRTYKIYAERHGDVYPDFTDVTLRGAKVSLRWEPEKSEQGSIVDSLDRQFNHINNPRTGSILQAIHSINDQTVKREAMEETLAGVLRSCTAEERIAIHGPLSDILFNRAYLDTSNSPSQNEAVRTLVKEVVEENFRTGSEKILALESWPHMDVQVFLGAHIEHALALVAQGLDDNQASFCQQLIQLCARSVDANLCQQASNLQQAIWAGPTHVTACHALCDTLGYENPTGIELGEQIVFVNADGDAAALSRAYYETFILGMESPSPVPGGLPLSNPGVDILFFKKTHDGHEYVPVATLNEQLNAFPFLRAFLVPNLNRTRPVHLDILQLGTYRDTFLTAAKSATFNGDLTSAADKQRLAEIFSPHMEDVSTAYGRGSRAGPAYVDSVLSGIGMGDRPAHERGYALLCLAAVFANYSSSRMFGTEYDSPDAVRGFAAALLGSAREHLASGLTPETSGRIKTYEDKLLGNEGFTCTAVLFGEMNTYLREQAKHNPALQSVYDKLIPPLWR